MATEFKLPELGENIDSASVVKVMVSAGDEIQVDQPVLEIETDKATVEVPSTVAGRVAEVRAKEGQKIRVGEIIFTLSSDGAAAAPAPPKKAEPKAAATRKAEPVRDAAAVVAQDDEDLEEQVAEEPSTTALQDAPPARKTPVNQESSDEAEPEESATDVHTETAASLTPASTRGAGETVPAAPSVRRLAREIGVDINQVPGGGPGGRVSVEDVKLFAKRMNVDMGGAAHVSHATPHTAVEPLPDFTRWGEVERQDMTSIRRRTAERMAHAWSTIPHVTQFDKADVSEIEKMRNQFGKRVEAAGGKLTVTAILVKVIAHALQKFPQFNASVDMANGQLVFKKYYNIGIAVDTDRGLLVPVIRDADKKNITEIAVELTALGEKARTRKTSLDDMQGGTFTITNLGGIGGTNFTPIVNSPEVAILGVARTQVEPVYVEGQFQPRSMVPLALSYDHRIIDGADAARFTRWVAQAIEQPFMLFMEG
ncbi:MAG: 2-oxo acid dehydrogenase subunit E2 [FCB group bacterium]|nr:2-oxo acid dehydrogenase subunit E2 [FCB group bacterium]